MRRGNGVVIATIEIISPGTSKNNDELFGLKENNRPIYYHAALTTRVRNLKCRQLFIHFPTGEASVKGEFFFIENTTLLRG